METTPPTRQLRALFDDHHLRVYQAFSAEIALRALEAQSFRPPFKMNRMTWIKPSFAWMMYRSGWGRKVGQDVVLGIDIRRDCFESALAHSSLSHFDPTMHASVEEWRDINAASAVRIQWDPERTLRMEALPWRTIQIGISGSVVQAYVTEWIARIEDVTPLARTIESLILQGQLAEAEGARPRESPYPVSTAVAGRIGASPQAEIQE